MNDNEDKITHLEPFFSVWFFPLVTYENVL